MAEPNPDLESFRQQWRAEVHARSKGQIASFAPAAERRPSDATDGPGRSNTSPLPPPTSVQEPEDDDDVDLKTFHDIEHKDDSRGEGAGSNNINEPCSALEHFERAVEMESQGSLGDSLNHYRKAYRMDSRVDRTYGEKHFPKSKACPPKPTNVNPSNAPATVTNTAHHSLEGSTASLTLSFANLSIPGLPPPTELSPPPPAPFTVLPSEMLVEILSYVAIRDVASFARLAQVCKHLAYLVATEDRIWRRVCEGPEVGFGAMHYRWACDILGGPLGDDGRGGSHLEGPYKDPDGDIPPQSPALPTPPTFLPIIRLPTQPTYALTFRHRPRIRFAGLYISTVNYVRPGASSPAQVSWNTPVHIVTYYRYLRFFRDGTVLSLLTTAEPAEVVHHLSRDFLAQQSAALPGSATVKSALRGRWRLSGTPELSGTTPSPSSRDLSAFGADDEESEGDIHIETEGPGDAKYTYKMHLALRSAGKAGGAGPRNTKLVWRGFWSYNRLTDDWAEFGLRNDRAFYWSRVRSYGMS